MVRTKNTICGIDWLLMMGRPKTRRKTNQFHQLPFYRLLSMESEETGDVMDDDIYWAGGAIDGEVCKCLPKHNIHHDDPTSWDKLTTLNIPRHTPILVATGRKISIVSGYDLNPEQHMADDNWKKSGEIYDLDEETLSYLPSSDIEKMEYHYHQHIIEEQVFYSFEEGSMLIVDTSAGSVVVEHGHPSKDNFSFVALQNRRGRVPLGLERCLSAVRSLDTAVACTRPVLLNRILYYFTYDLRLYGYDLDLHKWFRSKSLHPQIYPLRHNHGSYLSVLTLLLPLPNRDLLALTRKQHEAGCFTMASLSVNKNYTSLDVTVKHTQQFRTDYPLFSPFAGKAMHLVQIVELVLAL
ncbi:hypothetical protein FXO37_25556 [Capsicum annuum]|nr:hypothetical protein FXO37_25556 [Capsicum annuum]